MFSDTPIVDQTALGVGGVEQHPRDRPGALRSVEDAHPVVGQMHVAQLAEVRLDGEAERGVEGVDGPVALGGGDDTLVADVDLDRRLGRELAGRRPGVDERGRLAREAVARRPSARQSVITRNDSILNRSPSARPAPAAARIKSSSDPSAASKW